VLWGWLSDLTRNGPAILVKVSIIMTGCCVLVAFITPATPPLFTALVFMIFGATAVGWNGVFMAEIARCSPRGLVSVATGGAMVWNFAGILIGPATFATVYALIGSYAWTFGLLALIAATGCVFLVRGGTAAQQSITVH
jgi:sugar phosphate permease